uniref:Ubxn-1 n=1 Tax=Pristionchus pacificus TaxID=54126 RepID=A0A2A6BMR5_PRIPA|eukprot:PDM67262.1 ubxn-1 [Pristionchus pacificus]
MSIAEQLVEMGFDAEKAEEAAKKCSTLETAMDWLVSRQENEGMQTDSSSLPPQSHPTSAPVVPASYKCNDCGKVIRDENGMMFHASKTGHENFEESSDNIKPLTEEEKKVQAGLLKEKIKESMKKKAELEEKEKFEREKRRVQEGKLMLERNEKRKEMEQLAAIAQRKRDKEEEEAAKRRVLEQIKADRESRKAASSGIAPPPVPSPLPTTVKTASIDKKDYKEATIQIRLPSGELIRNKFGSNEELGAVRLWIEMTHPELVPFSILQPFPRKVMTSEDMSAPLSIHGLVPSGSLVVTRSQ